MKKLILLFFSITLFLNYSCVQKQTKVEKSSLENSNIITPKQSIAKIDKNLNELVAKPKNEEITAKIVVQAETKANVPSEILVLRKKHEEFLKNSPFKNVKSLSKTERKANSLPPNKYFEQEWERSINPETGKTEPEKLYALKKQLEEERNLALAAGRTPGDASDNNWSERGPNNVGGRVRAMMFDPNDPTYKKVFAGGVSGGLWVNTDITNASNYWTRVNIPDNLAVSTITYDPNNTNIFYVGTGESYVGGDVNGDGVWKSTDGGVSFTKVFGGITGPTTFQAATLVTVNSPAGVAGDYPCYPTTAFGPALSSTITADFVLVDDGSAAPTEGCNALTTANAANVSGKIALIRRGNCPFIQKITNAQTAGAIAVVMMNQIPGQPIPMGGTDVDGVITIPSVMISKEDGDALVAALGSGTVNGTLNPTIPGAFTGNLVPGRQHINSIKIKNNGGNSEIYVAAGDSFYGAANSTTYLGGPGYGLFKSIDGGANWNELSMPLTANGNKHCPNDIEIGSDGTIWVSTTASVVYRDGGGKVFSSTDGGNLFTDKHTVTGNAGGRRVELEISNTNPSKLYVLSQLAQLDGANPDIEVKIELTNDKFDTAASIVNLPAGNESREITYGFTGAQAFYDLMIESDPTNDQIVYVGGIDLYRSTNGGSSWTTVSNWTADVHSDQHAMTFRPGFPNQAVFGNDGGVYYSSSLSSTGTPAEPRVLGLNITQFYSVGVAPTGAAGGNLVGDYFAAGAQDNGTQYFASASAGIRPSVESQGGDGAFTMFDQGADKYFISNYVYNNNINYRTTTGAVRNINNESADAGAFICPMGLDSNLDILYSDYTIGTTYQIRRYKNLKSGTVNKTSLTNALLTSSPTTILVSPYTAATSKLYVGTEAGKLLKVDVTNPTFGAPVTTWTDITGPLFVGSISDVELGSNESKIFVTTQNYNVVSVWYSADAGVTWQNKEGNLPDLPVKCILQNPLNVEEVIIGTELGVWYTKNFSNASPTWNQSYNGMSNVKVTDLDLRNDNTVFAATYGRGIFSGVFTSTSLSADSFAKNNLVKIYPNPTNGIINVAIENYSGKFAVNVFDLNGRKILTESGESITTKVINLQGLQAGLYIVKIDGDNGLSYSEKVLLK